MARLFLIDKHYTRNGLSSIDVSLHLMEITEELLINSFSSDILSTLGPTTGSTDTNDASRRWSKVSTVSEVSDGVMHKLLITDEVARIAV